MRLLVVFLAITILYVTFLESVDAENGQVGGVGRNTGNKGKTPKGQRPKILHKTTKVRVLKKLRRKPSTLKGKDEKIGNRFLDFNTNPFEQSNNHGYRRPGTVALRPNTQAAPRVRVRYVKWRIHKKHTRNIVRKRQWKNNSPQLNNNNVQWTNKNEFNNNYHPVHGTNNNNWQWNKEQFQKNWINRPTLSAKAPGVTWSNDKKFLINGRTVVPFRIIKYAYSRKQQKTLQRNQAQTTPNKLTPLIIYDPNQKKTFIYHRPQPGTLNQPKQNPFPYKKPFVMLNPSQQLAHRNPSQTLHYPYRNQNNFYRSQLSPPRSVTTFGKTTLLRNNPLKSYSRYYR